MRMQPLDLGVVKMQEGIQERLAARQPAPVRPDSRPVVETRRPGCFETLRTKLFPSHRSRLSRGSMKLPQHETA